VNPDQAKHLVPLSNAVELHHETTSKAHDGAVLEPVDDRDRVQVRPARKINIPRTVHLDVIGLFVGAAPVVAETRLKKANDPSLLSFATTA